MDVRQDSDSEDDFRLENQGQGRATTTVLREVQAHAQVEEPPRKASRGKARTWTHVISLESHQKFEEWLQNDDSNVDQHWRKGKENKTSAGIKRMYHCSQRDCSAVLSALYCNTSTQVQVSKSSQHEHQQGTSNWGLSPEAKQAIRGLYKDGVTKPLQLFRALRNRDIVVSDKKQIENYLRKLREEKLGPAAVSFCEINEWCEERQALPEGDHDVYVVMHKVDQQLGLIRVVMSTKALQRVGARSEVLHVDATYKLTWNGFPALVAGVTDGARQFFPVVFSIMTAETADDYRALLHSVKDGIEAVTGQEFRPRVVVADAAEAITQAVASTFPGAVRRTCWFHAKKSMETQLRKEPKAAQALFREDLQLLQLCYCPDQFAKAVEAMLDKWARMWPQSAFPEYIRRQHVQLNGGWYEGFDPRSPSTNNALEAFNGVIKNYTFRERLPVGRFLNSSLDMVKEWSLDTGERKIFTQHPTADLKLFTQAWQYQQLNKGPIVSGRCWFLAPGSQEDLTAEDVESYLMSVERCEGPWESFSRCRCALWKVDASDDMTGMSCTCPVGLKRGLCKHMVAVAAWLGLVEIPEAAKNVPVGQKRKRGRPALAHPALVHQ